MSSRPALEQADDLVPTGFGLNELRMRVDVVEDALLIFLQAEEVVLLFDPLRLGQRMQRTAPVDEIFFLLERLAPDAVPAFVHAFVDVAFGVDSRRELRDAGPVARLRRPDEVVEADVERLPRGAKLRLHLIAVRDGIHAPLDGGAIHVLRMLVVPHQEPLVGATSGAGLAQSRRRRSSSRRAEVRLAVDVVNRRRDVEAAHDFCPHAFIASACTSFTGRLFAAASFAQSSNSGTALTSRPSRQASLMRTAPTGVSTVTCSRTRQSRSTSE